MVTSPIVDSCMTFEEAIAGTQAPLDVINHLCLINVRHVSFDGLIHHGQLVVHESAAEDVMAIFRLAEDLLFPIAKVIPIVKYDWSDDKSMIDNNTSAFNYRFIYETNILSRHALGMAVDINPHQNPVVYRSGRISPKGASYSPEKSGTLYESHPIVREFLNRGWQWGGHFKTMNDYHHFEKPR